MMGPEEYAVICGFVLLWIFLGFGLALISIGFFLMARIFFGLTNAVIGTTVLAAIWLIFGWEWAILFMLGCILLYGSILQAFNKKSILDKIPKKSFNGEQHEQ